MEAELGQSTQARSMILNWKAASKDTGRKEKRTREETSKLQCQSSISPVSLDLAL